MKTVFIFDQCGESELQFFTVPGDYSHLDRVYIGNMRHDSEKIDELADITYKEDWSFRHPMLNDFPKLDDDDKVIVVGFLP